MTEAVDETTTEQVQTARDRAIRAVTDVIFGPEQDITPGVAFLNGQVVDAVVEAYKDREAER